MSRDGGVVQYALLAGPLLSVIESSIIKAAAAPIAPESAVLLPAVRNTAILAERRTGDVTS